MLRRRYVNKKASIQDLIYIGVFALVFSIIILVTFKVSDELNTQFQGSDIVTQRGKDSFGQINNMFPTVIDNAFLMIVIGLGIVALVLASLVRIHPVFFVFFILILVIIIFLAGVFSNIFIEMANEPEFSSVANQLTFTVAIMKLLPLIVGIFGFILAVIMYKSWQGAQ